MQWFNRHENLVLIFPEAASIQEFFMLVFCPAPMNMNSELELCIELKRLLNSNDKIY